MLAAPPAYLSKRFTLVGTIACGVVVLAAAACGGDDPVDPTGAGGAGGSVTVGNTGGFDPVGVGGSGGAGNTMNEGGTGTIGYGTESIFGGDANVFVKDVAVDGSGNVIVVGSFSAGDASLGGSALSWAGGTGDDVFVAKYDGNGGHLWSQRYGDNSNESALAVALDGSGNIWMTGQFRNSINFGGSTLSATDNQFPDIFLTKLDPNGGHLFSAAYGIGAGYTDVGNALATDGNDNVVMAGVYQTSIDFGGGVLNAAGGAGDRDMFVVKLDQNGGQLFARTFGDDTVQEALGVAVAPSGTVALVGYSQGDVDFGGGTLTHGGSGARATLAVLDQNGNHVFSRLYQGAGDARLVSAAFASNGDVVAAGTFRDTIGVEGEAVEAQGGNDDLIALRYDGTGTLAYHIRLGSNGVEKVGGVVVDSMGYAWMTGWFKDTLFINSETSLTENAINNDGFVIRLGPPGNAFAATQFNATENAQGRNLTITSSGDVIVVGDFTGELDFGGGTVGTGLVSDLFLARFTP